MCNRVLLCNVVAEVKGRIQGAVEVVDQMLGCRRRGRNLEGEGEQDSVHLFTSQ